MKWLSDATMRHLCEVALVPDLSGTRYEYGGRLGQGGMATVYLVHDRELQRPVALKVLHDPIADPDRTARLADEARILAQLEHPGIVPVHDMGTLPDGRLYYAMKLIRGKRLDQHVHAETSLADRLRLFDRVCEAVAFAHAQGVIHRDLKPQNIMVGAFGEVLVLDWGVAQRLAPPLPETTSNGPPATAATKHLAHGTVVGTPGYMAPEQEQGDESRTGACTDVYALGGLLYFLLTGRAPSDVPPRQLNRAIPRALEAVSLKARAVEPRDRYGDVPTLVEDVSRFQSGQRVRAYPEGILETSLRLLSRYRAAIALVAMYLVVRIFLLLLTGR